MSQQPKFKDFFTQTVEQNNIDNTTLNIIKDLLEVTSNDEARDTLNKVGLGRLFDKLNTTTDSTDVTLTCTVLEMCFRNLNIGTTFDNYSDRILHLLKHDDSAVRKLAVYEIHRTVMANQSLIPLPCQADIYAELAHRVGDSDLGIASKAIEILSKLNLEGLPRVMEELKVAMDGDSSSRCNAYEAVINISANSEQCLNSCVSLGYIDRMIADLKSDDILYQLNILELLSKLAVTTHGINYLVHKGVLGQLAAIAEGLQGHPLSNLLVPGYMKFFGSIAHKYPQEVFKNYPFIVTSLFDALNSEDNDLVPVALDTMGFVGSTVEGKLCFAALGAPFTITLKQIGQLIQNTPTDLKVRALLCMQGLIGVTPEAPSSQTDPRITLMTREWFYSLSENPLAVDVLFTNCKNPFPDIQHAALALLDSVCQHTWGHDSVASTPGFVEFLLDRATNLTKENKELKYKIIERLSQSSQLDPSLIVKLKGYVDQGPFFAEETLQVAMEEGQ